MLSEAEDVAAKKAEYSSYDHIFGEDWFMAEVRFLKSAAKFLKKSKDKQLKKLYQEAIDKICQDYTIGHAKSGDLNGIYGYDIYYNKTNHELVYTVEYVNYQIIVVIMAGTRENFYDELKRYMIN